MWPRAPEVFKALHLTRPQDVKVVIVGQDPYHTPEMAMGLAFSVPENTTNLPPSLKNIFKEVEDDMGFKDPAPNPDLTRWAKQGVLLLNTCLTVREGQASSHSKIGWQLFTKAILQTIIDNIRPTAFILWGNYAQSVMAELETDWETHLAISSAHPSPFSAHRGFFGSKPFSRANTLLIESGQEPISW